MTKWAVLVETSCTDPECLDEFHKWYNQVHVPDVLETEGVVEAVRYESVDPDDGRAKYLAIYEIEADDLQAVLADSNKNMEKKAAEGRISDLMQVVSIRGYKQLYSSSG